MNQKLELPQNYQLALKVLELQSLIELNFGVILIGEAGTGKSSSYKILKEKY